MNKFVPVSVPRNRDLYARVGGRVPALGTTGFTSEFGMNKMQQLAAADAELTAEMEAAEAAR